MCDGRPPFRVQEINCIIVSPTGRTHVFRNPGVEAVGTPLAIILSHPQGELVLPIPTTQDSAWLEILLPK